MLTWLVLGLGLMTGVLGLSYVRRVRQRRRDQQIILRWLTECEHRRNAWQPTEGDGIRPVRPRYKGLT